VDAGAASVRDVIDVIRKCVIPGLGGTHEVMVASDRELAGAFAYRSGTLSARALNRLREAGMLDAANHLTPEGVSLLKAIAYEIYRSTSALQRANGA
jgi:ribosomal protein S19E (S16A)